MFPDGGSALFANEDLQALADLHEVWATKPTGCTPPIY